MYVLVKVDFTEFRICKLPPCALPEIVVVVMDKKTYRKQFFQAFWHGRVKILRGSPCMEQSFSES